MILLILVDLAFSIRFVVLHYQETNPVEYFPQHREPLANLVLKTTAEHNLPNFGLIIVRNLRSASIDVELRVETKGQFYASLKRTHDYDMFLISLNSSTSSEQLFMQVGGFNNPANLNMGSPYVSDAFDRLNLATLMVDVDVKRAYLIEWQNDVMDKILFLLPLVTTVYDTYNQTAYLGFNLNRPFVGGIGNYVFLTEPGKEQYTVGIAVRKSICYAIGREEMNNVINDGRGYVIDTIILPYESYWINNNVPHYYRNADLAYDWQNAAGYHITSGGYYGEYLLLGGVLLSLNIVPILILIIIYKKWKKLRKKETLVEERKSG